MDRTGLCNTLKSPDSKFSESLVQFSQLGGEPLNALALKGIYMSCLGPVDKNAQIFEGDSPTMYFEFRIAEL